MAERVACRHARIHSQEQHWWRLAAVVVGVVAEGMALQTECKKDENHGNNLKGTAKNTPDISWRHCSKALDQVRLSRLYVQAMLTAQRLSLPLHRLQEGV